MQDDNTTQPADDSSATALPEPPLSLSTNPSDTQLSSAADDAATTTETSTDASTDPAPETPAATEEPSADTSESSEPAASEQAVSTPATGDLESIKTSALEELAPLINELDQPPEDRYRTLMMIIQSSDNQELVKEAYEAAQKIEDKKAKAEALLNILNEINYFTGKDDKPAA